MTGLVLNRRRKRKRERERKRLRMECGGVKDGPGPAMVSDTLARAEAPKKAILHGYCTILLPSKIRGCLLTDAE